MNKKDAEKKIRTLATQVCVKHEEPDEATMAELNEAGYRVERMKLNYLDGIFATFPDGSMHYATKTQTTRGSQNKCALYEAEDVHRFETCTRMLTEAEQPRHIYTVDAYADAIKADGLRNQIKDACEQMRKMLDEAKAEEPANVPGQDDETPLECYEGFTEEPAKPAEEKKPEPEKAAAEERKAAEPEKEPQPFGSAGLRDDPPSPRSASGTGVIALISTAVLSCLIGGAVFYGLQMQGMLIEQDAKINALHGTLDRANAGRLSAEREVSSLKNSIRSVNHGFSSIRKDLGKQAAADAKLSKRMDDIEKSIAAVGNRDKVSEALRSQIEYWEIAEASFLADAAQRKLVLDHNPDAALTLLKGAAGILQGLGDEGTLSARKALESDIAKVAAMKRVDPSGIVMKLGTLVDMTGSLELHGFEEEENRPDAIDGTDNEPSSDISEWRQNLSRSWNKFLRNFVVVRYRAPGREYRLSPNGETLVRENLKSLLLTASLAVSREKDAEFRKSLSRIDSLLGEYFEKDGAHVKEFRAALDEIRQTGDITFSPEDLESQNILRKLVTAQRLDVGSLAALDDKGSAGKTDGGR